MRSLLVASLLCACWSRHAPDPSVPQRAPDPTAKLPDGPPLVTPGERMSYRVSIGGVELATYDIGVGEIAEIAGRSVIVVQSHAKAAGLVKLVASIDDTLTSWIDVETGRPQLWIADEVASKGVDRERTEARLHERDGTRVPVDYHMNNDPPKPEPQTVSLPDVWDYNAFLVAVRAWEAPPGSTVTVEVFRSRYMWNVTLRVRGKATLVTELGELPALRFDGRAYMLTRAGTRFPRTEERSFSIWISDDDGRVPLQTIGRTDYGDVKLEIVDYQPGHGQRLRAGAGAATASDRPSSGTASRRSP